MDGRAHAAFLATRRASFDENFPEARHGAISRARKCSAAKPVLEIQNEWSRIPEPDELLIERV